MTSSAPTSPAAARSRRSTNASTLAARAPADAGRRMGTSQSTKCAGDFCEESVEPKRLGPAPQRSNLSDFRRKLLDADAVYDDEKATTGAAARGIVPIPLRCVVNARRQGPLVQLMLRRQRAGFSIHVFPSDPDDLVCAFPARIYANVLVCATCAEVYALIDRAHADDDSPRSRRRESAARESAARESAARESNAEIFETLGPASGGEATPEAAAVWQAQRAVGTLTTLNVAELRSYSSPPPAVQVAATALFVLLSGGSRLSWGEARRAMSNGDAFLQRLMDFDATQITPRVIEAIQPFLDHPLFRPDAVAFVSRAAAAVVAWVLGTVEAARWRDGRGHARLDVSGRGALPLPPTHAISKRRSLREAHRKRAATAQMHPRNLAPLDQLNLKPRPLTTRAAAAFSKSAPVLSQMEPLPRRDEGKQHAWPTRTAAPSSTARTLAQHRQMDRLASRPERGGMRQTFLCRDGSTRLPFQVLGHACIDVVAHSFVVVHDFFDTLDATLIFWTKVVQNNPSSQVVVWNFAGQAGTSFTDDGVNAPAHAAQLEEKRWRHL
ncbi:microtubule-binding stalk of dynein motor-domain-containing protein [Pelagophyceae sp. CCMP2097]|nr:microtubule-binding stalk of dynein motor-domain-containing protein [Pelagophyceae sp. CCMP2097]